MILLNGSHVAISHRCHLRMNILNLYHMMIKMALLTKYEEMRPERPLVEL